MKSNRLEQWYKRRANSAQGAPGDQVWQGIAAGLDAQIAQKRTYFVGLLLLLFTVGTGASVYLLSSNAQTINWAEARTLQQQVEKTTLHLSAIATADANLPKHALTESNHLVASANSLENMDANTSSIAIAKTNPNNQHNAQQRLQSSSTTALATSPVLEQENSASANALEQQSQINSGPTMFLMAEIPNRTNEVQLKGYAASRTFLQEQEKTHLSPFSLGIGASMSSLWRLNHETYKGFKKTSLVSNNAKWASDVQLMGIYHFSSATALQVEYSFAKSKGQSYQTYYQGQYLNVNRSLSYRSVAVMFKSKINSIQRRQENRGSVSYLAGPYISFLQSAQIARGDVMTSIAQEYKNYDVGVNLGLQYDYAITDRCFAGAGVRTSIGLNNTYPGSDKIPSNFNQNRHFALEAQVNLTYRLQRL